MNNGNANITALLKRGYLALEDKEWDKADSFFEQSLNLDAESAEAYLGKLMAELKVSYKSELSKLSVPFDNSADYAKAIRFGDSALKEELGSYISEITARNESERAEAVYSEAKKTMEHACAAANGMALYKKAAEGFAAISGYKDSDKLNEDCLKLAEQLRCDNILNAVKKEYSSADIPRLGQLIENLMQIKNWKDASSVIEECKKRKEQLETDRKNGIISASRNALKGSDVKRIEAQIPVLSSLNGYADSKQLISECEKRIQELNIEKKEKLEKRRTRNAVFKKAAIITSAVLAGLIAITLLLYFLIIPEIRYSRATNLYNEGKYVEARHIFVNLNNYKDCMNRISDCDEKLLGIDYKNALELLEKGELSKAKKAFRKLKDFKNSPDMVKECDYRQAFILMKDEKFEEALKIFMALYDYSDSIEKIEEIAASCNDDVYTVAVTYGKLAELDPGFWEKSRDLWGQITRRHTVSAGWNYTVAVRRDGTVYATDVDLSSDYQYGQADVENWEDIIAVEAGWDHTVGLKSDGTVVAVGNNEDGQCNVENWTNIVAVNATSSETYGLRADGTIISTVSDEPDSSSAVIMDGDYGNTVLLNDGTVPGTEWKNMIDVADNNICVGLGSNGKIVIDVPGYYDDMVPNTNDFGSNIIDIDSSMYYIVALRSDGTVIAFDKESGEYISSVKLWENIVQISSNASHIVGLTADGKVESTYGGVSSWNDVIVPDHLIDKLVIPEEPEEKPEDTEAVTDGDSEAETFAAQEEVTEAA